MEGLMLNTTNRHGDLVGTIYAELLYAFRKPLRSFNSLLRIEEGALVHWGEKSSGLIKLVDVAKLENVDEINHLEWVQPDIMFFHQNKYLQNERKNKIAGYPDLIVEVWSEGNNNYHIDMKRQLYKTSTATEQWYMYQDKNEIERYIGSNRIKSLDLTEILHTESGISIDLRDLAL